MGEWETFRIEEIAQKIAMGPFGSNIKVETFVSSGVPIISGQHLHASRLDERASYNFITMEHAEKLSNSNVFPGDIIFTHAGTIGQVALILKSAAYDRYVISQRQFYLRVDKSKADPAFVTRWFHSPVGQHRLLMHASQVGVPSISRPISNLKTIKIDLPTLDEQKAISSVFDALDDKIELNRRMNETLEAMARAIFKDWFVDFGPTRAKAEDRPPYLAPEIWDLFPDALDDEDKPMGWTTSRLDALFDVSIGRTPLRKEQHHFVPKGKGQTWISIKDMAGVHAFIFESEEDITPNAIESFRVPLISADAVLVSFKLTVGRVAIAAKEMHSNEAIAHLKRTSATPVGTEYTYYFMLSVPVNPELLHWARERSGIAQEDPSFRYLHG